jgi:diguanylate cyclase (GGDEF)-like protein
VFRNFGMKIFVAGGGSGKGLAVNNRTKATTYMKMAEVQAGLGIGAKKFQLVWVFANEAALDTFVDSGWTIGGRATASAKAGDRQGREVLQGRRVRLSAARSLCWRRPRHHGRAVASRVRSRVVIVRFGDAHIWGLRRGGWHGKLRSQLAARHAMPRVLKWPQQGTSMLRMSQSTLQQALEQLEQATLDHAAWRDHLVRVISDREPIGMNDLAPDAHRHCPFGRWYYEHASSGLRALSSFAMLGAEHEDQHRIAARLLRSLVAGVPIGRQSIDEFEEASARLSYALYFLRREIECALDRRDTLTDAHSSGEMVRDLREWHALARLPGRQCCLALMEVDRTRELAALLGDAAVAQARTAAVNLVAGRLRLSDRIFRYDESKFLIRLSGTGLEAGNAVTRRLREALERELAPLAAAGAPVPVTVSFGIAMLDPEVGALESVDRADQALTLAQTSGGNRVISWDPSVTTGARLPRLQARDVPG